MRTPQRSIGTWSSKLVTALCLLAPALFDSGSLFAADISAPLTLFVATNGNDQWSGGSSAPNAAGTDGPLATVTAARDAIRRRRAAGEASGAITVYVRGGTYRLNAPFTLEPQDSGTTDAPVVYTAYGGERPVLSGGRLVTGFRQNGALWECDLPEVKAGAWYFRQLFVNGERRQRARSPNEGYFHVADFLPSGRDARGKEVPDKTGFIFGGDDLKPWRHLEDVNLVLMHSWETSIHPLRSVDPVGRVVKFAAPLKEWWTIGYWERAQRYYIENAFEALDQPGEWYLNRETGVLSYYPKPGERLGGTEVVAPVLPELVRFAGNPDAGLFLEHVSLKGLTFHHADWELAPEGNSSTQAAVEVPAAVLADGALHSAVENCEIAHVGTYGLWFRRGCKDCRAVGNRLFDLGAGGIRVGEANMARTDAAESSRCLVDNNHIFDGGRVYPAGVGIWVGQSSHNRIAHNDVHDLNYSGMSVGWNWNDATNRCHDNLIEFNHVHHLVNGVLSDAGAIYTLGVSPGSIIRNNVFHDIWPYHTPAFGWGIYLDATCGSYLVESNVVYNTQSGGLMFNNGGHEHVIQNNVFAFSANHMLWPFWEKRPNVFRRNLVYLTQGDLFIPYGETSLQQRLAAKESLGVWDENIYWHTGGPDELKFMRRSFADWQMLGLDTHSQIADPQFENPAEYDFRLKPGSPALGLGFQPVDIRNVGLYGDPKWVAEARAVTHPRTIMPPAPAALKPVEINDDFEQVAVGAHPEHAQVGGEELGASIRVSDEQSASGKHSLKFTDSKDLRPSWQPHVYYEPHILKGAVRQSFDLWLDTNTLMFTEWRDSTPYPNCVGPSVAFDGQGRISSGGKVLVTVPTRRWVHLGIEATLGKEAPAKFTLTVTPPGGPAQTFSDLPYPGKGFRELHWMGFSSTSSEDSIFYLDNLKIERR